MVKFLREELVVVVLGLGGREYGVLDVEGLRLGVRSFSVKLL